MKTYFDCYPCFLRQSLEAARMAGASPDQEKAVLDRVLARLQAVDPSCTPPEIGGDVHAIVREVTGSRDPYHEAKARSTRQALELYPWMRGLVAESSRKLETAVRLSIAGNIIDFGPQKPFDLVATVERVLAQPFAINDYEALVNRLAEASSVLILADNAGETVFDRLLIEELPTPVIYTVKAAPVLNDATLEDAIAAGIGEATKIVTTGAGDPGTILSNCSPAFRSLYEQADIVLAKGQANYETLSHEGPRVFFLLQTKCPVIARDLDVAVGSIVLRQGGNAAQGAKHV